MNRSVVYEGHRFGLMPLLPLASFIGILSLKSQVSSLSLIFQLQACIDQIRWGKYDGFSLLHICVDHELGCQNLYIIKILIFFWISVKGVYNIVCVRLIIVISYDGRVYTSYGCVCVRVLSKAIHLWLRFQKSRGQRRKRRRR